MCVFNCSVVFYSLRPHGLQPARLLCPWDFPGKDTGVSCHCLLQGIFPTQGSIPIFCIAGIFFIAEPSGKLKVPPTRGKSRNLGKGKQQSLQERRGKKILESKLHKCISYIKYSRFMTDSAFRSSQKFLISFTIKKESKLLG